MEYNHEKVDEMVLALLWTPAERLHAKGYISDPRSKAKSVVFSEDGERRARELFERHFGGKG